MRVCHCFGITDRDIRASVRTTGACTGKAALAGSGCGGCKPLVDAVVAAELASASAPVTLPVFPAAATGSFVPVRAAADAAQ